MRSLLCLLLLSLLIVLVGCSGKLTTYKARVAVLKWSRTVDESGTSELGSDEVSDNTGRIVIKGIQESSDNSAQADIEFDNFKLSGAPRSYTGNGTATFARYNDGTWVLKKVSMGGRNWDNVNITSD